LRSNPLSIQFKSIDETLAQFKKIKFRLGVTPGEYYPNKKVGDWIKDPDNQDQIVHARNDLIHLKP
jgi:hypothetical protein